MNYIWIVMEFIICLIEVALTTFLFVRQMRRQDNIFAFISGLLVLLIAIIATTFIGFGPVINSILSGAAMLLYAIWGFKGNISTKLFWGAVPILIWGIAEVITFNVFLSLGFELSQSEIQGSGRFQMIAMYCIVASILFFVASNTKRIRDEELFFSIGVKAYVLILALLSLFGIVLITDVAFELSNNDSADHLFQNISIASGIIIILVISTMFLVAWLGTLNKRNMQLAIQEERDEQLYKYVSEVESHYEFLREQQHDFKSHMQIMKALVAECKYQELESYLNDYSENISKVPILPITSDTSLNACISIKSHHAHKLGIQMHLSCDVKHTFPLGSADVCSLVSNILDNAIEACAQVNGRSYIVLEIAERNNMLMISVENSANGVTILQEGKSTKGGNHGLGIKHMRKLAAKADGFITLEPMGDHFITTATLPLRREDR